MIRESDAMRANGYARQVDHEGARLSSFIRKFHFCEHRFEPRFAAQRVQQEVYFELQQSWIAHPISGLEPIR